MPRRAPTRTAGAIAATLLCAAVATEASAQVAHGQVLNTQIQLGDVVSGQTLNVVTASDQVTAATNATGNSLAGGVQGGDHDLHSTQSMQGSSFATTTLTMSDHADGAVNLTSQATGNDVQATVDGGALTVAVAQSTGTGTVQALTDSQNPDAHWNAGGSVNATAIANSTAFGATNGRVDGTVSQDSQARTLAESRLVVRYSPARIEANATAISNNLQSTGTAPAAHDLAVRQRMTDGITQAATFANGGNVQDLAASSQAVANNVAVANAGGSLTLRSDQDNRIYVRSQAEVGAYEFGGATAVAYGAGNAVVAGDADITVTLDTTQVNDGGVEVVAGFSGQDGYDGGASATAIGNSVTGYACSECGAQLTATNSQTNLDGVHATANTDVAGSARAVISSATAVGNAATFYVSRPAGH